ncbi:hypothetical protein ACFYWY_00400 [Streptomyces sp. NPDC002870]|uniref:hypothetical protein n=1 Tax=Streptomyces sp. NPDC002870 TaxID=3364666 RepID=UPI0036A2D78B
MNDRLPHQISDAAARLAEMQTLRGPAPGCTVRIRFRAVAPDEVAQLTAVAADHARHGAKR